MLTWHLTYDIPREMRRSPQVGHYLVSLSRRTHTALSAYLILKVREVRKRNPDWTRRFKLTVQRVNLQDALNPEWWLYWNRRHKRTRS